MMTSVMSAAAYWRDTGHVCKLVGRIYSYEGDRQTWNVSPSTPKTVGTRYQKKVSRENARDCLSHVVTGQQELVLDVDLVLAAKVATMRHSRTGNALTITKPIPTVMMKEAGQTANADTAIGPSQGSKADLDTNVLGVRPSPLRGGNGDDGNCVAVATVPGAGEFPGGRVTTQ
ncbi:hypothetical protein BaRGS_00019007 [Batillaria attramentaria]|uniref:Uncharacterized protein n=1 Tax=Batillaria attramentaria TaxID=370345 RepID=A0ABD0KRW6_9CAEN